MSATVEVSDQHSFEACKLVHFSDSISDSGFLILFDSACALEAKNADGSFNQLKVDFS